MEKFEIRIDATADISIQHPLASVELVAWDSSCTLLISKEERHVKAFREAFPLSEDLKEYNTIEKNVWHGALSGE